MRPKPNTEPIYIRVARAIDAGYQTKPEIVTHTGLPLDVCTSAITQLWRHNAINSDKPRSTKSRGARYTMRMPIERLVAEYCKPKQLTYDMTVPLLEQVWPARVAREALHG